MALINMATEIRVTSKRKEEHQVSLLQDLLFPELSPDLSNISSDLCLHQNLRPFRCLTPKTPSCSPSLWPLPEERAVATLGYSHHGKHNGQSPVPALRSQARVSPCSYPKSFPGSLWALSHPLLLAYPQTCSQYFSLRSFFPQHKHLTRFCFPEAALLSRCTEGLRYKDFMTGSSFLVPA